MKQFVIDASALALALIDQSDKAVELRRRLPSMHLHAPHLVDAELGNVMRRHEAGGLIGPAEADAARLVAAAAVRHRYAHVGVLAAGAWALRHNLTFYDALYAALAGLLDVPLLTADERLAKSPGLPCAVEVI